MPGLTKIGCTTQPVEERIRELSVTSGVPVAFKCHFAAEVTEMAVKEKTLFQLFADKRVNPKREFFEVPPEKVVLAIRMGTYAEVTPGKVDLPPDEQTAFEKAEEAETGKRANFRFDKVDIPVGADLTFTRNEDLHATVTPGNKLRYDGQILSITGAAKLALQKVGTNWEHVQGTLYWMYEQKTLDEIRRNKEEESVGLAQSDAGPDVVV
jgi:hypothetical protein